MSSITESIKLRVILIRYFNKILNDLVMLCCSVDAILTSQWFNMPISVYDKNITDLQSKMSTYLRFKCMFLSCQVRISEWIYTL